MQRTFITGDHWLYYKLYAGPKTVDMLLAEVILPACNRLISDQLIDKWFFIRYNDPKNHLRLRLHFSETKYIGRSIDIFYTEIKPFIDTGHINKVQTDTYKRELERYGSNSIELSESMFWYDSEMIAGLLDLIDGDEGEKIRWLFSLRAIDQLLQDFNFTTQQKFDLLNTLDDSFSKEFNINAHLVDQLSNKYRTEKKDIFDIMNRDKDNGSPLLPIFNLLKKKSNDSTVVISEILDLQRKKQLSVPINNLIGSYIHMLLNRLFRSRQRLHEMVIYGFLFRYYRSQLARIKYST